MSRLFAALCGPRYSTPSDEHARIVGEVIAEANRIVATATLPTGDTLASASTTKHYEPPQPVRVVPLSMRLDLSSKLLENAAKECDAEQRLGIRGFLEPYDRLEDREMVEALWAMRGWIDYVHVLMLPEQSRNRTTREFGPGGTSPLIVGTPLVRAGCDRIDKTRGPDVLILRGSIDIHSDTLGMPVFLTSGAARVNLQNGAVQIVDDEETYPGILPEFDWNFVRQRVQRPVEFIWRTEFAR